MTNFEHEEWLRDRQEMAKQHVQSKRAPSSHAVTGKDAHRKKHSNAPLAEEEEDDDDVEEEKKGEENEDEEENE